jgi:hypothetical protein
MLHTLKHGILILCCILVALFIVTRVRDASLRSTRTTESTFVSLVDNEALDVNEVSKVEVVLPEEQIRWHYARVDGLWRMPEFAGAFALNEEVDALVKMLLQSRARPVGSRLADEARYGLLPSARLTLSLFRGEKRILKLYVGGLAPGAAKDERYVLREGDDTMYLFTSNPSVYFDEKEVPALLDRHILPRALSHGMPDRITFSGSRPHELRELVIKQLPVDPRKEEKLMKDKNAKKEPTHEFIGTLVGGSTKIFDDGDGMLYVNKVLDIEFDKIVGSISPVQVEYRKFDEPVIEISLHRNDSAVTTLSVSGSLIEGKYPILNKATGQMFIVSSEKVEGLLPTLKLK